MPFRSPPLRLGVIADPHIRRAMPGVSAMIARRSREAFDLLPRALEELRRRRVDFLMLAGDLLDAPLYAIAPDDYYDFDVEAWSREAEADYRDLKAALDGGGIPYMAIPGNHDLERAMWRVFDRAANVASFNGFQFVGFCDREIENHVPRRLDRERALWEEALSTGESRRQIHLQHFLIAPKLEYAYPHNYFEWDELRRRTVESGRAALSLSGHYHLGTELVRDGGCAFSVAPAFCEFPHAIQVYEVGPEGVSRETIPMAETPLGRGRRVVFLDRDGVITVDPSYRWGPERLRLIPGAARAVRRLREACFAVVVVSSQSCIGAGYVTRETVRGVMDRLCRMLRDEAESDAAQPDAILFSAGAGARAVHSSLADLSNAKPSPRMFEQASQTLGLPLEGSYVIGDTSGEARGARAIGGRALLVRTGHGARAEAEMNARGEAPDRVFDDLAAAAEWILAGDDHPPRHE
ncbi:MAG: HAD-IIIA family hydrolase [Candidatus Sumerlaeota bacterium]|nr:HAD-IIIA family hydrolase [Candidatus Sumerlaeota bacterium]